MQTNSMQNIQIIGITGRKFSGKDTTGGYFVERHGFERLAFADPLKNAAHEIFGFNNDQLYGNEKEIIDQYWKITPRQALQFIGTDLFRNHICELLPDMGKDIWVYVLKRKITNELKKNPAAKFVITDVRFPNELQAIKELGGITIKIKRTSVSNNDEHESEILIDGLITDFVLQNDGTKEDLFDQLSKKLDSMISK